jgi:DNA/RNA endonuclease G (NUC1)
MSKSTPPSVLRSRLVPLTMVLVFGVMCAALIFTPVLASISKSPGTPSARLDVRTTNAPSNTGVRFDASDNATRTLGTIFGTGMWTGPLLSTMSPPVPLGATYTWNQTGTAAWTTSTNWTPTRTTPAADDVLVFNNGATTTVTGVPTQTIGQLSVSGNTTVNLQSAAAVTLTISGGGTGLSVAAGSALNCNAANAIIITLPSGTTGNISGAMTFSSAAHRLLGAAASAITFNNGATFTAGTGFTGNPFGTTNNSSVVFSSGSTYVFLAGANPFGASAPGSAVVFQTGSLYSHQSSSAPSFSGRTYANFELKVAATISASGGNALVVNNLTITTGTFNWGMTGAPTPSHAIKGNISVASGQTLNFNPSAGATLNLSGGSTQTISGLGTLSTNANQIFNVSNANGISLQKDITINGSLVLTSGNITATSNTLTISSTGAVSRTSGHIIGNLQRGFPGAGSKTFDVGTANGYSPVTLNATAGTFPANVTVKATQGPQPNFPNPSKALQRYWTLAATGITANLTFNYLAGDVPGTANENNFVIFKYDGTLTQPGGTVSAATHTATINGVTSFSDWTCAEPLGGPVPNCPTPLSTNQGTATSEGVSAIDADGTVTSASITSPAVAGITLDNFVPAPTNNTPATATLNVAASTAPGTYNVTIQFSNNDPTPETGNCTIVVNVINQPISPNCPTPLTTTQGTATSEGVSATDPDGTVTSAAITSAAVPGITLDNFVAAPSNNTAATATLNVAASTAAGTYNVVIQYSNNDSPTPQTANCTVVVTVQPPPAPPNNVVISQVYGGGGNSGSTLKNDYIELINHSNAPVDLSGWSVQAFVSTTSTWQVTPLTNTVLQPGQYYLIQEAAQGGGTDNLPTPDAVGTIPVSSTSTKVALVNNTTTITAACPNAAAAGIVDLVGYGGTDCFEGSGTAPTLDSLTANFRRNEGCFDTNQNANDFVTGSPSPRNTSSPTHDCTSLSAYGNANPSSVLQGNSTTLTVYVAAAQNPASSGVTVTADLSQIGGSPSQSFSGSGSVFSFTALVPVNNPTGMKSLPVTVTDAQSRTFSTTILLSVLPIVADHITISQIYGGGGNTGATYTNDYVELYNPTANNISVTGWSLQYASAAGTSWTNKQPIGGVIGPGEYYLVALASGGVNGAPLPVTPNISGDINISATTGKIALVSNSANLSGGCPLGSDPDIVDFVGYGTGATCREGNANSPAPGNSTAIFRKNSGSLDSDQNGTDFQTGVPSPRRTASITELGPWVSGTDPSTNDVDVPYDATITVNFSEPVNVDPGWFSISCASTGSHNSPNVTEAHTNDFKTYAITPNATFQFSEQCSVTVFKTAVHDQDTDDSGADTDTLFANETWSFTVVAPGQAAPYPFSVHLTMGNPSSATASPSNFNNYLMEKPTYSISYNRDKGTPNWVSWHLDPSWYGSLARVDTFRPDPAVDPSWYRVQAFDYSGSGFDRGHMTPNADRDNQNRIPINQGTYLMTNMVPQAPDNNQGPWAALEAYLRTQTDAGNEIYIVSGPNGVGGTGSNGSFTTIANGNVTVPSSTWKVALVLTQATGDDTARVNCSTRSIAVIMPNVQGIRSDPWESFLTTVDAVETLTGYDFFSNLPEPIQRCVEAGTNGNNPPLDTDNDGVPDTTDNCPTTANANQLNTDGDSQGDACDADDDNDGVADTADNCPLIANADQADGDGDGIGNACDPNPNDGPTGDLDGDGVLNNADNCPTTPNANQANNDGDSQGDVCDPDDDNDGVLDGADNCPFTANADQADGDSDGIGNACDPNPNDGPTGDLDGDGVLNNADNCPTTPNANQANNDGDAQGDVCDADDDNDGVLDGADNCPFTANADQADGDSDGIGNACDPNPNDGPTGDLDGDGIVNNVDNCPMTANTDQADFDHDGIGDACDADDDNDNDPDTTDCAPLNAAINHSAVEVCDGVDNNCDGNVDESFTDTDHDGQADCVDTDDDNDTVADATDNCPLTANTDQADNDNDGIGDACDDDDDNDTVLDANDNCPLTANTDQADNDNDGAGDACDADDDNDTVPDTTDNCPLTANTDQADNDHDGAGDACDADDDNDGVLDATDNCPLAANSNQADNDHDGIGDTCDADDDNDGTPDATDNCPLIANTDQADTDHDGIGEACDPDDDNDGVLDGADNCPLVANPDQADSDHDGIGDVCDGDNDNDGVPNGSDNCPFTANPSQADNDHDGVGDACDTDDDNDGIPDATDNCTFVANSSQTDTDHDGAGDACDTDDDNDGVLDESDNCPLIANSGQADNDHDGIGDACDSDDDNDGVLDANDNCQFVANPSQADNDHDGVGDSCDTDDDNDGVPDTTDNCPFTANPGQEDGDHDGIGDACDGDFDNDGIPNATDNCPTTPNPDQRDTDGDGVGDACTPFQFPEGGEFVIGDNVNLSGGATVYFWGSQWSPNNPMSGGSAPNSFVGFENGNTTPTCSGTWTSAPGNSSNPPSAIPQYMAVIVSSSIQQNGSVITGNIKKLVIIRTNPGYGPSPGHPGTGQVVAVICSVP